MNWYEVLEVSPSASPQVIRAAYKSLMQRYHPDKSSGEGASAGSDGQRASLLAQAYAVLSDETLRQAYDRQLLQQTQAAVAVAPAPVVPRPLSRTAARAPQRVEAGGLWRWLGAAVLLSLGAAVAHKAGVFPFGASSGKAPAATAMVSAALPDAAGLRVHLSGLVVQVRAEAVESSSEFHSLTVPSIILNVGPWQAQRVALHLKQEAVTEALRGALAALSYEKLIAVQGQATLARAVLDAVNATIEPASPMPEPGPDGVVPVYGVQSVVLPQSYSVR